MNSEIRAQVFEAVQDYKDALDRITHPAQFTNEHQAVRTLEFVKALGESFDRIVRGILAGEGRRRTEGLELIAEREAARRRHPSNFRVETTPGVELEVERYLDLDHTVLPFQRRTFDAERARSAAAGAI